MQPAGVSKLFATILYSMGSVNFFAQSILLAVPLLIHLGNIKLNPGGNRERYLFAMPPPQA